MVGPWRHATGGGISVLSTQLSSAVTPTIADSAVAGEGGRMMTFTLIDRHLGRSVAIGTALVLGVFTALFAFIVLVDVLPDYGKNGFEAYELLRYVALSQ